MPFGVIYLAKNLVNGKMYVGQTTSSVPLRVRQHRSRRSLLGLALIKYGRQAFTIEIVDSAETGDDLDAKEVSWIARMNCMTPFGYNRATGGRVNRGWKQPDSAKAKLSVIAMGRPAAFKGKSHTPETRAKLSLSHQGAVQSTETRQKRATSIAKHHASHPHPMLGIKHSEETRAKMAARRNIFLSSAKLGRFREKDSKVAFA